VAQPAAAEVAIEVAVAEEAPMEPAETVASENGSGERDDEAAQG
jgi:hypothetical protein